MNTPATPSRQPLRVALLGCGNVGSQVARILLEDASFRVAAGDRVGLVGRNGAGKTTLTKVLAGQGQAAAGSVTSSGGIGYLPQDPRTGDLTVTARQRILSARGLDQLLRDIASFITRYQWYLTPITFLLVAVSLWRQGRRGQSTVESVDELQEELATAERELEGEATVHDAP